MKLIILLLVVHQVFAEPAELNGESFAAGINGFTDEFMKKLEYKDKNLICSPFGLSMALGMLLKAANGTIYDDIYKMLNMSELSNKDNIHNIFKLLLNDYRKMDSRSEDQRNATLELTNAALWKKGLPVTPVYTDKLKEIYEASVSEENFAENPVAIKDKINKFVKEKTHELIPELLQKPLPPNTVFVIMNIIYFKGFWKNPFQTAKTRKELFYNGDKTEKETDFMTRTAHYKHYHCNVHKASIIELPYKGDFSMFVILPDEKYGLSKMIEEWPKNKLSDYIVEMNKSNRTTGEFVKVYLPKFDVDYSMQLLPLLKSLGADVTTALTPLNPTLIITEAFQSARIKVYEAGTEAAAVTILAVNRSGQGQKGNPIIFKADHPFSYCIRDMRSGINIFCGTVMMFK